MREVLGVLVIVIAMAGVLAVTFHFGSGQQ